ncbi:MAG: replication protein [Defluviitaleaceae bacterium]|nr:replication protein [Defluviitaleaceae bacterium]
MEKDTKTRKWIITINNPENHGFTREYIREVLKTYESVIYWCISDEIGKECSTPHTHIFLYTTNAVRWSTMQKKFPKAHFDPARGTSQQCRDYIFKQGKWTKDKKADTNIPESHEEFGQMPIERPGQRNDISDAIAMLEEGATALEVIRQIPSLSMQIDKVESLRQKILNERYGDEWRELEVTYVWGDTGTGKTRDVLEEHGNRNVCRVTNYRNPFDMYTSQDVLMLDEFRSSIRINEMLTYMEGHAVALEARYYPRQAMYTKLYIISNIPLEKQYPNVQADEKKTWQAFLRRINKIKHYRHNKPIKESTVQDELYEDSNVYTQVTCDEAMPFG